MKEIVYNCINNFSEIVAEGDYKGVHYICLNRGTHPCAYIVCDPLFLNKHKTEYGFLDCINVHGGVNYTGALKKLVGLSDREGVCFGWSYDTYTWLQVRRNGQPRNSFLTVTRPSTSTWRRSRRIPPWTQLPVFFSTRRFSRVWDSNPPLTG